MEPVLPPFLCTSNHHRQCESRFKLSESLLSELRILLKLSGLSRDPLVTFHPVEPGTTVSNGVGKKQAEHGSDFAFCKKTSDWATSAGADKKRKLDSEHAAVRNPVNIDFFSANTVYRSLVSTRIRMQTPFFLNARYWKRHNMTKKDVEYVLNFASSRHIWTCALVHNFPVSVTALKQNCSTWENAEVSTKCNIHQKFLDVVQKSFPHAFSSGDCVLSTCQIPKVGLVFTPPVYSVPIGEFEKLRRNLISFVEPFGHIKANYAMSFLQCLWVPLKVETAGVFCEKLEPCGAEFLARSQNGTNQTRFTGNVRYEPLRTVEYQDETFKIAAESIIVTASV